MTITASFFATGNDNANKQIRSADRVGKKSVGNLLAACWRFPLEVKTAFVIAWTLPPLSSLMTMVQVSAGAKYDPSLVSNLLDE